MIRVALNDRIPRTLSRQGLEYLGRLARTVPENGLILDVWPLYGASTWTLARNACAGVKVLAVDEWQAQVWMESVAHKFPAAPPLSRRAFDGFVAECDNVQVRQGSALAALEKLDRPLDLFFEDAVGREAGFGERLAALAARLRPGGIAAGNNYVSAAAEVVRAIDALAASWGARAEVIGRVWALVKPRENGSVESVYERAGPYSEHDIAVSVRDKSGHEARYAPGVWAGSLSEWKPLAGLRLDWAVPRSDGLSGAFQLMNAPGQVSAWAAFGEWAQVEGHVTAVRAHLLGAASEPFKLAYQACCLIERRGRRIVARNTRAFRDAAWTGLEEGAQHGGVSALRCYVERRGTKDEEG